MLVILGVATATQLLVDSYRSRWYVFQLVWLLCAHFRFVPFVCILKFYRGKTDSSRPLVSDAKTSLLLEESTKRLAAQGEIGFTQSIPGWSAVCYPVRA